MKIFRRRQSDQSLHSAQSALATADLTTVPTSPVKLVGGDHEMHLTLSLALEGLPHHLQGSPRPAGMFEEDGDVSPGKHQPKFPKIPRGSSLDGSPFGDVKIHELWCSHPDAIVYGLLQTWSQKQLIDWICMRSTGEVLNESFLASLGVHCDDQAWLQKCLSPTFLDLMLNQNSIPDLSMRSTLIDRTVMRAAVRFGPLSDCAPRVHTLPLTKHGGSSLEVHGTYGGCAAAANGRVYFLPRAARAVLCVDPAVGTIKELDGPSLGGSDNKYSGACVGPDGKIYGIPMGAEHVLRINPENNAVELFGASLGDQPEKWGCGALNPADGCIYCAPHDHSYVLKIECAAGRAGIVGQDLNQLPSEQDNCGDNKWFGAAEAGGKIYFTPLNANFVLEFDPSSATSVEFGADLGEGPKYLGCCRTRSGLVVCAPAYRQKLLRVDPAGWRGPLAPPAVAEYEVRGLDASAGAVSFCDTVLGADGHVYGVPSGQRRVLRVAAASLEPNGRHHVNLEAAFLGPSDASLEPGAAEEGLLERRDFKSMFGCLAPDGYLYASPLEAREVLRVCTLPPAGAGAGAGSSRQEKRARAAGGGSGAGGDPHPFTKLWRAAPELWFLALRHPFTAPFATRWLEGALAQGEALLECGTDIPVPPPALRVSDAGKKSKVLKAVPATTQEKHRVYESAVVRVASLPRLVLHLFSAAIPEREREELVEVPFLRDVLARDQFLASSDLKANLNSGAASGMSIREYFAVLWKLKSSAALVESLRAHAPDLVEIMVNISERSLRLAVLQTQVAQLLVLQPESVGDWVKALVFDAQKADMVVDYFRAVPRAGCEAVASALSELDALIAAMLQLPFKRQTEIAETEVIKAVMNLKLAGRLGAMLIVYSDLAVMLLVLALFVWVDQVQHQGDLEALEVVGLGLLALANVYFAAREVAQAWSMRQIGLLQEYFLDLWNLNSIGACTFLFLIVAMAGDEAWRNSLSFRIVGAICACFTWLKALSIIKGLNKPLATFVFCVGKITRDLKDFMVVMFVLIFMFANVFYFLLGPHAWGEEDQGTSGADQFSSKKVSVMTLILMTVGVFDRTWFDVSNSELVSELLKIWFVLFLFFIFIIMLNVLIAVASESYDNAQMQAQKLFLVSRLELVAEMDALGLTKLGLFGRWEHGIMDRISFMRYPFLLSLDGDEGDLERDEYQGRVKTFERMVKMTADTALESAFLHLKSTKIELMREIHQIGRVRTKGKKG